MKVCRFCEVKLVRIEDSVLGQMPFLGCPKCYLVYYDPSSEYLKRKKQPPPFDIETLEIARKHAKVGQ